jgi:hypothetical protein
MGQEDMEANRQAFEDDHANESHLPEPNSPPLPPLRFKIEQLAIAPKQRIGEAMKLLSDMGLANWSTDVVHAIGSVWDFPEKENSALLAFNYMGMSKALEFEVLHYLEGENWLDKQSKFNGCASHIGMHCSEEELSRWFDFFAEREIGVAQEVYTDNHTNPVIADSRRYHYVIFDTRNILGFDVKFIVRRDWKLADG